MSEKDHSSPLPVPQESGLAKKRHSVEDLERKAVRRIDYHILPVMSMFYLLSFLDRTNIGNARVAGLQKDLKLTDHQYQICVSVLFVPYILAELPSNLLLRRVGPRYLMPTFVIVWGTVVTLQGLVTSYAGLVAVRVCMGLAEGPMGPSIVCYLSGFYNRKELSLRIALFFSTASLSGAFSGLLAAAIQNMDGIGGRPGWAWIFILEGLFTICVGLIGFFLIPSTPRESKFLTFEQKELIMARLELDRPSIRPLDKFSGTQGTAVFGLALFLPSIVREFGFSRNKTQLLSVGPFALGFFAILILAYLSDRHQRRGIVTALTATLALVGYSIFFGNATNGKYVAYGAFYLMVPGIYAATPALFAWLANNSEPHYRRATSIAVGFMSANAGGILSTWSYPSKDGPKYRKTMIMNIIFCICIVFCSLMNVAYLSWKNKSKARTGRRELLLEKYNQDEDPSLRAWMELGDEHPDFRYTL